MGSYPASDDRKPHGREHGSFVRGGPRSRHSSSVGRKMTIDVLPKRRLLTLWHLLQSLLSRYCPCIPSIVTSPCCFASTPPEVCEGRVALPRLGLMNLGGLWSCCLLASSREAQTRQGTWYLLTAPPHVSLFCHVPRITCSTALSRRMRLACALRSRAHTAN